MVLCTKEILLVHVVISAILFTSTAVYTGSDWPSGWYGLPQPKARCPSRSWWGSGWWHEDRRLNNQSASRVPQYSHLRGTFTQTITRRYFCMKKKDNGLDIPWPKGQYCIYQALLKSCPPGFVNGSIGWKNKDGSNHNHHSGNLNLPSGVYTRNTRLNYCCRVDGSKENSISLPVDRPFFLLAYNSSECQSVMWARATHEYLRFAVQEDMTFRGSHPFVDDNYALRYCYYQRSNQTLSAPHGTISRYLNQTSIDQERYTTWHIKPSGLSFQFLVVRFTRFTFHASNISSYLEVLDGGNESAPSLGRFSSTHSPLGQSMTSSTKQLLVALNFGDRNGTYDFEFNYNSIPKMTTTVMATTHASSTVTYSSSKSVMTSSTYAFSSNVTSHPHTSSNVTSSPTATPGYLRYHGDDGKRKLLLSITLPIGGFVTVLLVLLSVVFIRRRRRRRRYSRMDVSVYDSDQELEDDMDGYFEEIHLTPACSLLQLSIQPIQEPKADQASNDSWTSEYDLFIRHQHESLETDNMNPSASTSGTNQTESDPDPFVSYNLLDINLLTNYTEKTEINEAESTEMTRFLKEDLDEFVVQKSPRKKDTTIESTTC